MKSQCPHPPEGITMLLVIIILCTMIQPAEAMTKQGYSGWNIGFLNICGLSLAKWKLIDSFMNENKIELLGISEAHLKGAPSKPWLSPNFKVIYNPFPQGSFKYQTLWIAKSNTISKPITVPEAIRPHVTGVSTMINGSSTELYTIYLPNEPAAQNRILKILQNHLLESNSPVIIGGDFNARLFTTDSPKGKIDQNVLNWINEMSLKGNQKSRIDQVVASPNIRMSKVWTHSWSPGPDHFPITINIDGPTPTGRKKIAQSLSNSNLNTENFAATIQTTASVVLHHAQPSRHSNSKGKKISKWNSPSGIAIALSLRDSGYETKPTTIDHCKAMLITLKKHHAKLWDEFRKTVHQEEQSAV
eukprot:TRINITY_DN6117_c0_g1_i1.p1 TRINITY_DN6117_c0_g1~~TRINITY_DN6117_c0_g1_i1.p1  ORF type:complete len:359 (-),score=30.76 TRINITY_DN6117_c0_g1_i1:369-1445(-)